MFVQRVQYALKQSDKFEERKVIHFETDSTVVMMNDGRTLDEFAKSVDGERKLILTGGVIGQVVMNGHDDVRLEVTVVDDSHRHTGGTVFAGKPNRAVISDSSGNIDVSEITTEELSHLDGVRKNIQDQLDYKIKESLTNGYVTVDYDPEKKEGLEIPVYIHPKINENGQFDVNLEDGDVTVESTYRFTEFLAIKGIGVDDEGHISNLSVGHYKIPRFSQFYNTSIEPTDQVPGDFWLETMDVIIPPGNSFSEDLDDKGRTETTTPESEKFYFIEDIDTGEVIDAPAQSDFVVLDEVID